MSLLFGAFAGSSAGTQTIGVTNANVFFSPYNTYSDGAGAMAANNVRGSSTYAILCNTGAYLKFRVTVASGGAGNVSIQFDTSMYNGITAALCPTIYYTYNDRPWTSQLLAYSASTVTQTLATGLAAGTYEFFVGYKSIGAGGGARFGPTPLSIVKVLGVVIDDTASIPSSASIVRSKRLLVYGDSQTEGINALLANNDSANDVANASNDAFKSWVWACARALDCEVGYVCYGGQGAHFTGISGEEPPTADRPALYNADDDLASWNKYFKGAARDITSPVTPDYIVIQTGLNDGADLVQATVTEFIDLLRTTVGATPWIFWFDHAGGSSNETTLAAAMAAAASTTKTKYIDIRTLLPQSLPYPSEWYSDAAFGGGHPNYKGHALHTAEYVEGVTDFLESGAGGGVPIIGGAIVRAA